MNITEKFQVQQEIDKLDIKIANFIKSFRIGTLLNKNDIRKQRGVKPLKLFNAIFILPFYGVNYGSSG